ncbi:hypothetical protein RO575_09330 [Methylomonas sp. MO1]|jgi:hypothetical protein|uniref:DUF3149 domain-containing protein n=2 Tax=Methylomonas TaxID=416 RepID=A0ABY2CGS3_METMH|nr:MULTISPECIES: hypothetical protein [Methylomonas]MCQ8119347.1 hypothetical protein [Methylomonas sp. WSC-7]MDT4289761.1 hypothetical protein [Methylomonas sp. MO1]TCV76966.1 hypothetical protein EDE11_13049 [Methylomonas methanica]
MGAILDLTEMLKEPSGMIGALVIIAAGYFFVKWVFAEPKDEE